jgi:hypothetical protein
MIQEMNIFPILDTIKPWLPYPDIYTFFYYYYSTILKIF